MNRCCSCSHGQAAICCVCLFLGLQCLTAKRQHCLVELCECLYSFCEVKLWLQEHCDCLVLLAKLLRLTLQAANYLGDGSSHVQALILHHADLQIYGSERIVPSWTVKTTAHDSITAK